MAKALTQATVDNLAVRAHEQYDIADGGQRGLSLRISYGGTKTYCVSYRVNGKQRRMKLGRVPYLSLKEARKKASATLALVDQGKDPAAEKLKVKRLAHSTIFSDVLAKFIDSYARPRNASWRETERTLDHYFAKTWGKVSVASIDKSMVRDAIEVVVRTGKHSAANQAFANIRKFFSWCVEQDLCAVSPCNGLKMPAQAVVRERVLTHDEIRAILKASDEMGYPFGPIIRLLFLTAQRRSEVAGMAFAEIDQKSQNWLLPRDRTKSARAHSVPLVLPAIDILASLPIFDSTLCFPARGRNKRPVSGFSQWKAALDRSSGVDKWRIHDIRRTVATGLAELKVAPHVIEKILNHSSGTIRGVAAIYNRYEYKDECRDALNRWAAHLHSIEHHN